MIMECDLGIGLRMGMSVQDLGISIAKLNGLNKCGKGWETKRDYKSWESGWGEQRRAERAWRCLAARSFVIYVNFQAEQQLECKCHCQFTIGGWERQRARERERQKMEEHRVQVSPSLAAKVCVPCGLLAALWLATHDCRWHFWLPKLERVNQDDVEGRKVRRGWWGSWGNGAIGLQAVKCDPVILSGQVADAATTTATTWFLLPRIMT